MTVGRISALCWTVFAVMSVAFLPLALAIAHLPGLSPTVRTVLAIVVVGLLWWGPFGYAMYLALAVIGKGDRRLLKRGVRGTAEVLAARATNMSIQSGGAAWSGARVYRYRLRVTVPGRAPYETVCQMCAYGIDEGSTVAVAVAPRNHKRVVIDVAQPRKDGRAPGGRRAVRTFRISGPDAAVPAFRTIAPEPEEEPQDTPPPGYAQDDRTPDGERVHLLVELDRLHREGALTDAEFAAEKARILGR